MVDTAHFKLSQDPKASPGKAIAALLGAGSSEVLSHVSSDIYGACDAVCYISMTS